METLSDGGMKVCSNGPGLMTKMSTILIYGKKTFKNLLQNQKLDVHLFSQSIHMLIVLKRSVSMRVSFKCQNTYD